MFQNFSERLSQTLKVQARLTEDNVKDTLREVCRALREADLALPAVKAFIDRVRERALCQEVSQSLSPGQQFVKTVQQELEAIVCEAKEGLTLKGTPAVVLMAGPSRDCIRRPIAEALGLRGGLEGPRGCCRFNSAARRIVYVAGEEAAHCGRAARTLD